ncbi:RNA polymerase sigma factor [Streptacidiphilus sp. PAMC 29251]
MSLIGSVETSAQAPAPAVFEALHQDSYTRVAQQTFLLTGHRRRAERCADRAFQLAWSNWDTVGADPSPEGWVRATAFELALSPWHHPRLRRADPGNGLGAADQLLLAALLRLPKAQRRALVLHDALGLSWEQVAQEVESSTPAAYGRVVRARLGIARQAPKAAGADARKPGFARRLGPLLRGLAVRGCPAPDGALPSNQLQRRARLHEGGVNAAAGLAVAAVAGGVIAGLALGTPWHPPTPAFITFGHRAAPPAFVLPAGPVTAAKTGPGAKTAPVSTPVPTAAVARSSADADRMRAPALPLNLFRFPATAPAHPVARVATPSLLAVPSGDPARAPEPAR